MNKNQLTTPYSSDYGGTTAASMLSDAPLRPPPPAVTAPEAAIAALEVAGEKTAVMWASLSRLEVP